MNGVSCARKHTGEVLRAAFVMEQTLGHVTVSRNLRAALGEQQRIAAAWLPVTFDVHGPAARIPGYGSNWSLRASARALMALCRTLATQPVDAALFHTQVTSLLSVPLMRRLPSIVSLDATPLAYDSVGAGYEHRPDGAGPAAALKRRLNGAAFGSARALISWSEWAQRSLVQDYGADASRVHVIAPGAAEPFFEIGRERRRRQGSAQNGPVRLLFVGGDFARKGGHELLTALDGWLGRRCELDLVTKADVPAQPGLRVHHNVTPNSPALLQLFAEADLFVLPTYADCLAVVLMEAAAAGLPMVTTRVGALEEVVTEGETGLTVPPGDVPALRAALGTLIGHPAHRRRLGRNAQALAEERFNARRNNGRMLDLVAQVAHSHN